MSLTKKTIIDQIQTTAVGDHYVLNIRERNAIMEDGEEVSSNFRRYALDPNQDVSTISDPVVKAQFEAVMTSKVKDNYAKFLKDNEPK